MERAVQAGTKAGIPVMVDFGINHAERPLAEPSPRNSRPGDIYTALLPVLRGRVGSSGKPVSRDDLSGKR